MRVLTLAFLFLAALAAVHAACPTDCLLCKDATLNSCTLPNPEGGCIAPCTVPKCPQNQNCGINGVWDGVNCQCVVPTAAAVSCPTDCAVCSDAALNSCTLPNPAGGCVAPCTVPKCPQNQNCGINGVWDGVNCQCVVPTSAPTPVVDPVVCPKSCLLCKDKTLNSCWTVDPATNTCVRPCTQPKCPQNQNCGFNGVWDGVNCQCVVNTPAPCKGKCSAGFHWDSTNCKCVCPEVQMCVKGKHFDTTKCACVDNQPTKPVCVDVVDCLEGFSWNPVDCKCERNVQCLVDPCANKKCEFGACLSNFAGGCNAFCPCDPNGAATCKTGEMWNSQSCTCEQCVDKVACIRGTHWSPLACKCVPN